MATHTAIAFTGVGKPLEKITVPVPDPKENELLLKVTVAGSK
jgi:NADPH2:quinone reductase